MRLKLYRSATVKEAMALVRAELGPEALILSTRRIADGVELTAAIEPAHEPAAIRTSHEPAAVVWPAVSAPSPRPESAHASAAMLAYHGTPAALAVCLAGPDLAGALSRHLPFGALPVSAPGSRLLMAGAPGAGKTLTVARLATRLVLAGITPTVITADGKRAGGAEELAAYTRLLGLRLMVASTPSTLARAIASAGDAGDASGPILIDSAGINPFADGDMHELSALADAADAVALLVMPAGQDPAEAAEQVDAYRPLHVRHLLPTRLDLARRLGSVLAAASTGLILSEAGVGTGASDGIVPLTPESLAARMHLAFPGRSVAPGQLSNRPASTPAARAPVFPTARAHAAQAWNTEQGGY